jgi:hypothetical protein
MTSTRTIATATGMLFLITFITAIPGQLFFYVPLLTDHDYILGVSADTNVSLGALLEIILVVANIGTAVVLYPLLKRQNDAVALGFVAAAVLESAVIMIGTFSLLSVVTVRQEFAGAAGVDAAALVAVGRALVALRDATFLLGPGLLAGLGNGILLGYLMYRSGLVPRGMALLGLIGGPLLIASMVAVLFGAYEQVSLPSAIATIPEFLWELSLGIYLVVNGFSPSPITAAYERGVGHDPGAVAQGAMGDVLA